MVSIGASRSATKVPGQSDNKECFLRAGLGEYECSHALEATKMTMAYT